MALIRSGAWLFSLAVATGLAGCTPDPKDVPAPEPATPVAASPVVPVIPVPPPALGRADLLAAVAAAADAFATGQPAPKAVQDLAGRRFSIRLPFGCLGPGADAPANYSYDAGKGSLKLTARPEIWTGDPDIRALVASPMTEAIEGFWIPRPWVTSAVCPALRPPVVPTTPSAPETKTAPAAKAAASVKPAAPAPLVLQPAPPQTVGLVSVFEAGDSRLQRRGARPYEVVRKVAAAPVGGFRLVLEGRIVEGAAGAVACRSSDPNLRPTCLVRVELDRVAMEGATGELFGEWRS